MEGRNGSFDADSDKSMQSPSNGINDDVWDMDDDDLAVEKRIAKQGLEKVELAFSNSGYKEGVSESKLDHLQHGFDEAFERGMRRGKQIGEAIGALKFLLSSALKDMLILIEKPVDSNIGTLSRRLEIMKHTQIFSPDYFRNLQFKEDNVPCIRDAMSASGDTFSVPNDAYKNLLLNIIGDTVGVVLFIQVLYRSVWMSFSYHGALPPVAPPSNAFIEDEHASSEKLYSTGSCRGTQLPSSYDNTTNTSEAEGSYLSKLSHIGNPEAAIADYEKTKKACFFQCSVGDGAPPPTKLYNNIVPFLSIWLLGVDSILGAAVYIYRLASHANPGQDCELVGRVSLAAHVVGCYIIFFAMGIQSHIVNDRCTNIFIILVVGGIAHFVLAGLTLGHPSLISHSMSGICHFSLGDRSSDNPWVNNLPLYIGIPDLLMCFFVGASMVNGSRRLIPGKPKNFAAAWLQIILAFNGIGFVLLTALFGVLWWAATMAATGTGHFKFMPWWTLFWPIISRLFVSAIQRRIYTDSVSRYMFEYNSATKYRKRRASASFNVLHRCLHGSVVVSHLLAKGHELSSLVVRSPDDDLTAIGTQGDVHSKTGPPSYNMVQANLDAQQKRSPSTSVSANQQLQKTLVYPVDIGFKNLQGGKGEESAATAFDESKNGTISNISQDIRAIPESECDMVFAKNLRQDNVLDLKRSKTSARVSSQFFRPREPLADNALKAPISPGRPSTANPPSAPKPRPKRSSSPTASHPTLPFNRISLTREAFFSDMRDDDSDVINDSEASNFPTIPSDICRQIP
ncbi:hypothetical protein H4219_003479 [Mycoemilia scoparia]|uniref:Protein YAE1 n=1 Tax=Mycoemilia scoparia TaxID=417184 RepID=A0A9W8A418_9FUNG|nr:hypothetical protein H4219_003479 [Mycoemilia scoparia]